jgi:filamentous hemagglutinin family protein
MANRELDPRGRWEHVAVLAVACGGVVLGKPGAAPALSQPAIVFDTSLGKPGGALVGNTIFANRGICAGTNLLHSFSRFNVGPGQTITFETPDKIGNILARVTGGEASTIEGMLATTPGKSVDLYLINPAGIMFGEGAKVNVGGAFTATTADYVSFGDGSKLSSHWATTDGTTTLVSAPPVSFGFLPEAPSSASGGAIGVELKNTDDFATFSVNAFSAVAREIEVSNSLFSGGGSLAFQTATSGEVARDGTVSGHLADVSGGDITFTSVFLSGVAGQSIAARASGDLTLTGGFLNTVANTTSPAGSGTTELRADGDLSISGTLVRSRELQNGVAGPITVAAGEGLRITNGGLLRTTQSGVGTGGAISVFGKESVLIDALGQVASEATNGARGGSVRVESGGDLLVTSGGSIKSSANAATGGAVDVEAAGGMAISGSGLVQSTATAGSTGGSLFVKSSEDIAISGFGLIQGTAAVDSTGGDIEVVANQLRIAGPTVPVDPETDPLVGIESLILAAGQAGVPAGRGGNIRVAVEGGIGIQDTGGIFSSTNGRGTSGSIHVIASRLEITGGVNYPDGSEGPRPRNFFITGVSNKGTRDATGGLGDISVDVDGEIILRRGGFIDATNFNPDATAGDVTVTAGSILADRAGSDYFTGIGSGTEAETDGDATNGGSGGNVSVTADSITLRGGAQIAASSRGGGDAGSVTVTAKRLLATGSGAETPFLFTGESGIAAATLGETTGKGGSVRITANNIRITDGASISSTNDSPAPNGGNGGDVILEPGFLYVNGGRIEVSSKAGDAGALRILGGTLVDFRNSQVVAEAQLDGGNIEIERTRHVLLDHSMVSANATMGDGGNIGIGSAVYLANESSVTASSEFAADGEVSIDSQAVLSGAEGEVEVSPLDVTDSLQPECTDWMEGKIGSFIRSGRGSTTRLPGGYLPSLRLHRLE